jgi:hypothetical protein
MKVIFLDNDGVICLGMNHGSRFKKQKRSVAETVADGDLPIEARFDNFDGKAIKVLNTILLETGAEIIVSSDWRLWATLDELGQYYESQGIIKRPIGFTDSLKDENLELYSKHMFEEIRILEVNKWLKNNQVESWVAIDDMDLGRFIDEDGSVKTGLVNFVRTPRLFEGIKQSGAKEKIIGFLNENN